MLGSHRECGRIVGVDQFAANGHLVGECPIKLKPSQLLSFLRNVSPDTLIVSSAWLSAQLRNLTNNLTKKLALLGECADSGCSRADDPPEKPINPMCKFLSVIVRRTSRGTGFEILHNNATDSHEDLVTIYKLRDTRAGSFARLEFRPPDATPTYADPASYALNVDEFSTPDWLDLPMQEQVASILRGWISDMIVHGDVDLLCGGTYILSADAKIGVAKNSIIKVMLGSSNVGVMWGSSKVGEMLGSSKVGEMRGSSKVGVMRESSNVGEMWESSKVGEMRESSNVGVMLGSSNVGEMLGSSNVGTMRESSNVGTMLGSSNVGTMLGSSKVGVMWGSSNVGTMRESSKVFEMWGSSKVGEMRGSSNVGTMRESSKVFEMWGSSKVGEMRGSSKVGEMRESSNVGEMRESSNVGEMWGSSKAPKDPIKTT